MAYIRTSVILLIFVLFFQSAFSLGLKFESLTCEYAKDPIGIDVKVPRFSWVIVSDKRGQNQIAYELEVSLFKDKSYTYSQLVWQTGKVLSSSNLHIEYKGKPLQPFSRYRWKVRIYDMDGKSSDWSGDAFFETAMLDSSDWTARWIGDGQEQFRKDEDFYGEDANSLFRKEFAAGDNIVSARLYISGLGYYEAYINGVKVGDRMLEPGWTNYAKTVLYSVYDVGSMLKNGKNALGVMLGNGWYNPLPLRLFGRFNMRNAQQTGRPCLKAELRVEYSDCSSQVIRTDSTWQTAKGPVLKNSIYLGESYDARKETPDWDTPKFKSIGWRHAVQVEGPSGEMRVQMVPPIRVVREIVPIKISKLDEGKYIVDMGENFAGVARISVKGVPGTQIKLRYGEDINIDGSLNYFTSVAGQIKEVLGNSGGPGSPKTAWQEDSYILGGYGVEQWNPRFTFHGFRYVEVSGWPGTLLPENIRGLCMHSDLERVSGFRCSNEMFNQLYRAIDRTFLSNVFSVQSDCPAREKLGYGADMVVTSGAFSYNYRMTNFYQKSVSDFANDQQSDGAVTETAPFIGIADDGYGGYSGPIGWQLGFGYLQECLYEYYGDKRIIEENYKAFIKQMRFLQDKAYKDQYYWGISDHEAIDPKPVALTSTAFYYHHAMLASKFAGILGKCDDSLYYGELANKIKSTLVKRFYVPGTGRFDNATQSAQIFGLWYGLSPDKEKTYNILLDEIKRHNYHLSTGIFSTKMLFDVLREFDNDELAYKIANQREFPSWGFMLKEGATTLWENWKHPDNVFSQNHPMFGSVNQWFFESLLGIQRLSPAFAKVRIEPQMVGDLEWANGWYDTLYGRISSNWKKTNSGYLIEIKIPVNCTAEVCLPFNKNGAIKESGKPVKDSLGIKFLGRENGLFKLQVGSGRYLFEVKSE